MLLARAKAKNSDVFLEQINLQTIAKSILKLEIIFVRRSG
jgi:hypothetical protein